MQSSLAIARPNPHNKNRSGGMLRRISTGSSSSPAKRPVRSALKRRSRMNSSSKPMLSDVLAKHRKRSRMNPSMSIKEALTSNKRNSRRMRRALSNPSLVNRENLRTEIQNAQAHYETARDRYERDPSDFNKGLLHIAEMSLDELQSDIRETAKYLGSQIKKKATKRKATKRKATKRKATKRKATKRKATKRKNPSTVSAIAANALRSNPRKSKKSSLSASAITRRAKDTTFFKRLRSPSKRKMFLHEFAKAFKTQNRKRGVTEDQAIARAAFSSHAKVKSATTVSSARKAAKKPAGKVTRKSHAKRSSTRGASLAAAAKESSFYKMLNSSAKKAAFVKEFKKVHAKMSRKAASAAQANAWAALSAYSKVNKASTRKNPLRVDVSRDNPRKASKRARAKRLKPGMRKSARQVLSNYGPYTYSVVIDGKVVELKVSKSSSVYKQAKKGGLSSVKLTKLRGKKNTPTSLNLRSVYKTVDGRPSKKDFQRAINAWAGALDGGKIRGVSRKDIQRTRMNPKTLRKHTVTALANPAPISEAFRSRLMQRANAPTSTLDKVKLGGLFAGASAIALYSSNIASSMIDDRLGHRAVGEGLPVAVMSAVGGYGLYRRYVQQADISDQTIAVCSGIVAGSITSLIARTLITGLGKAIPGFERLASAPNGTDVSGYLLDNQSQSNLKGINDMSRLYGTHVGRYVQTPSMGSVLRTTPSMGRYVKTPSMGRYVKTPSMGRYIPYPSTDQLGGVYKHDDGTVHQGDTHMRSNPNMPGRISSVGANTQMVPNRGSSIPAGMYDINAELQEDINLQEPLTEEDLQAEGLVEVYANGHQMRIIRSTPDVARQIVESNMGSIVGESRVIPGSVLVLANTFDTPQNHALTDRLRLNRAPEVPKGASFPQAGGVFSRVAFASLFPSVDNQASFQEFGVRVK